MTMNGCGSSSIGGRNQTPMAILKELPAPFYIDAAVLGAGVAATHTVPEGAVRVLFAADAAFYARYNGAAAVPVGAVTDGSGAELNPGLRGLTGVTEISLISSVACKVTMAFYNS